MMRPYIFAIIALMTISGGLVEGQDESSIKLELLYEKPFTDLYSTSEGFPPTEIKQILLRDDIPQEDKDWLLNALRVEIARKNKILYSNDGISYPLPYGLKTTLTSDNYKYLIALAESYDLGGFTDDDLKEMQQEQTHTYRMYSGWQQKYDNSNEYLKETYRDSMMYWAAKFGEASDRLEQAQQKIKLIHTVICLDTKTGKQLWEKQGWKYVFTEKGDDIMIPSHISNDGSITVTVPGYYAYDHAYFYDGKGNEISKAVGFFGPQRCHDLSSDGEMFCAITRLTDSDTLPMAVIAFDPMGNELWRTEIQGVRPFTDPCIAVSPNHKYVAAALLGEHWWREAYTTLLNRKGTIIGTYNCNTYFPAFSQDDEYLILWTSQDTTYFIETQSGQLRWKKHLSGHADKTAIMPKDKQVIFIYSMITNQHPAYLLDLKGNIVWYGTYNMKKAIGLSPNGYFLIPSTDPQIIIYEVIEEKIHEEK